MHTNTAALTCATSWGGSGGAPTLSSDKSIIIFENMHIAYKL